MESAARPQHEIAHGKLLSQGNPEEIWGWGSPAGRLRAERRAALITGAAKLRPGVRALEIGCGTGMFTEIFARTGAQIVAVDLSGDLLHQAHERNLPPDRVFFLEKRFEDCELDGPFDTIIGSSVLHHLDIDAALLKIYALLRPGGIMSFAEPNMLNPQVFMERKFTFLRRWFWYVSPDETALLRWNLHNLLLKSGFRDIKILPFDWLHPASPSSLIGLINRFGRVLETTPLLREFAGSLLIRARRPSVENGYNPLGQCR